MNVPLWLWLVTVAGVVGLFVFDFYTHVRTPHEPSLKESGFWSAVYVSLGLLFTFVVWAGWGGQYGGEYIAGFLTEKSLSVDNLFVFVIIMAKFAVPRIYQQKVLLIGIVIALVMRGIFIALGAAAIARFSWVFYIFGAFLIYTAWKLAREKHDEEEEYEEPALVRFFERRLRTTTQYDADRITTRVAGRRYFTPMFIVMLAIGLTDLLFALDSIPAIFGLTKEPYIVFTANAFALMGLRQLYFLLGGLLRRLVYLGIGLSVILGFIGVKLILEALHANELPFLNGGEHIEFGPEIPIWFSLTFILVTIAITTVASLARTRRDARAELHVPSPEEIEQGTPPVPDDRPQR